MWVILGTIGVVLLAGLVVYVLDGGNTIDQIFLEELHRHERDGADHRP